MRILIIRNYPSFLDVSKNTYNIQEVGLAKALIRKGNICDVLFWTPNEEKDLYITFDDGKKVLVMYRKARVILKNALFPDIEKICENYDIVQPCEYNQWESFKLAKKIQGKVVVYHGPYFSKFNRRYNFLCFLFDFFGPNTYKNRSTKFITKSKLSKSFLISKGIPENNITAIGVGIDGQIIDKHSDYLCSFANEIKDYDGLKLLYVGRIEKRRNVLFLIDVLCRLVSEGVKAKLFVVGNGKDDYLAEVKNMVSDLDLNEHISWTPRLTQSELGGVYRFADVFLLPTEYDIFGMVLLESMHYGNLVITSHNGGSDMLIRGENTGIVLDCSDLEGWCSALKSFWLDKSKFDDMRKNASLLVDRKYTWDALADQFIETYQSCLRREYE